GIACTAVATPEEACADADILAACTDSAVPVLRGEWLQPGMHVISIGGRPELGTSDEYLGYVARPGDPCWRDVRVGRRAPVVTGEGRDVMYADIVAGRVQGRRRDA